MYGKLSKSQSRYFQSEFFFNCKSIVCVKLTFGMLFMSILLYHMYLPNHFLGLWSTCDMLFKIHYEVFTDDISS
jgi:hypothetical protein